MIRFLADASLRHAIVSGCVRREPAIDFLSAHQGKLHGLADRAVLAMAAAQHRILVTQDFRTMPRHFGEFIEAGGSSPGVFLVKQRTPLSDVIDDLVLVWAASAPQDWINRILEISEGVQDGGSACARVCSPLCSRF